MKFYATVGGDVREVDLAEDGIRLDGRTVPADLARLPGTPERHLLLGRRGFAVVATRADDGWAIEVGGRRIVVAVEDERARRIRELAGGQSAAVGGRDLRAPMPGLAVRVLAESGQRVEAGAPLVVIEAMKMENELRAEAPGTIASVNVTEGQTVNQGDVLVTFEP